MSAFDKGHGYSTCTGTLVTIPIHFQSSNLISAQDYEVDSIIHDFTDKLTWIKLAYV